MENKAADEKKFARRSSILKIPKQLPTISNDETTTMISKRVSFSSNYIKHFTINDEKDTEWGPSFEESIKSISSDDSTSSHCDFNKSTIGANVLNVSDMDISTAVDNAGPENVMPILQFDALIDKENVLKNYGSVVEVGVVTKKLSSKVLREININQLAGNTTLIGEDPMDVTCGPSGAKDNTTLVDDNPMDITCNSQDMDLTLDNDDQGMEFTCKIPELKNPNEINSINQGINSQNIEDMEFTCKIPELKNPNEINSITQGINSQNIEDMEFTCKIPELKNPNEINSIHQKINSQNIEDMEFTCKIPELKNPNEINSIHQKINSQNIEDMEFTCKIPELKNPEESHSIHQKINSQNIEDMEFTCKIPELKTPEEIHSIHQKINSQNIEDMEFTCKIPELKNPEEIHSIHQKINSKRIKDMELTNKNSKINEKQEVDVETSAESKITWEVPVIKISECSISVEVNEIISLEQQFNSRKTDDMESTCEFPKLRNREEINSVKKDDSVKLSHENPVQEEIVNKLNFTNENDGTSLDNLPSSREVTQNFNLTNFTFNGFEINNQFHSTRLDQPSDLSESENNNSGAESQKGNKNESNNGNIGTTRIIYNSNDISSKSIMEIANATYIVPSTSNQVPVRKSEDIQSIEASVNDVDTHDRLMENIIIEDVSSSILNYESCDESSSLTTALKAASKSLHMNSPEKMPVEERAKSKPGKSFEEELEEFEQQLKSQLESNICKIVEKYKNYRHNGKNSYNFEEKIRKINQLKEENAQLDLLLKKQYDDYIDGQTEEINELLKVEISKETSNSEELSDEPQEQSLMEIIDEKAKLCDDLWKVVNIEDGIATFSTLFGIVEVVVKHSYDFMVEEIKINSKINDSSEPLSLILEKELRKSLASYSINKAIGQNYNILSLLDFLQMSVEEIKKIGKEFRSLQLEHKYRLKLGRDLKATFHVFSVECRLKWLFEVNFSDMNNITRDCVKVKAEYGDLPEEDVLDLVFKCPKGIHFIRGFWERIEEFIRKHMIAKQKEKEAKLGGWLEKYFSTEDID